MIFEVQINSFEEYIAEVNNVDQELWFRGVVNKNYSLIPGAVRYNIDDNTEIASVLDFMSTYQNYHSEVESKWELYSLMQHYGLPTRLLDWSTSMIVALYFALDGEPCIDKHNKTVDRVVWGMTTGVINQLNFFGKRIIPTAIGKASDEGELYLPSPLRKLEIVNQNIGQNPMAIKMPYTNRRIYAQKGCFTIHGNSKKGIEEIMVENGLGHHLVKFVLNEDAATKIRHTLNKMEINEDDIYQDLNSLSKRIIRKRKIASK